MTTNYLRRLKNSILRCLFLFLVLGAQTSVFAQSQTPFPLEKCGDKERASSLDEVFSALTVRAYGQKGNAQSREDVNFFKQSIPRIGAGACLPALNYPLPTGAFDKHFKEILMNRPLRELQMSGGIVDQLKDLGVRYRVECGPLSKKEIASRADYKDVAEIASVHCCAVKFCLGKSVSK